MEVGNRKMKIAIDAAGPLSSSEKGGISYFLSDFLSALKDTDAKNSYLIFGYFWHNYREKRRRIVIPSSPNFTLKTLSLPRRIVKNLEEKLHIPVIEQFLTKDNISLFHSISAQEMPYFRKIKSVYSLYDLAYEINPSWYKEKWYSYVKKSAVRADMVVTTSFSTKNDIVNLYGISPDKIRVVYLGVNRTLFNSSCTSHNEISIKKYGLPEKFILTVATSVRRKNIPLLISAYDSMSGKGKIEKLVIVAGSHNVKSEIDEIVRERNIQNKVLCLSEVPTEDLADFYRMATLFIFPSLYEGFGLPVIEAMACGCPTILSNISSLPEVGGDAAVLVDPHNEEEIIHTMEEILLDEKRRDEMRIRGLERANFFTWEKTVKKTLKVYHEVIYEEDG